HALRHVLDFGNSDMILFRQLSNDARKAFANQRVELAVNVKRRRVHVITDLSYRHTLLDEVKDLSKLLAEFQRRGPPGVELENASISRHERAVARKLIDPVDAFHDHVGRLDFYEQQILRQRIVVVKLKVTVSPNKQIVDGVECASLQDSEYFFFSQKSLFDQHLTELRAGCSL